jgi:membrane protein
MSTTNFAKTLSPKSLWKVLKLSFNDFIDDKIAKLGAALAYYTIFSLPGILLIIITIADTLYGKEAIQGALQYQISSLVGVQPAIQIQDIIRNAHLSKKTSLAAVVGIITLIIGATSMFGEIQDSINLIWRLKAKPKRGWVKLLLNRLLSFSMVVTLGFLLLVSLVISSLITLFSNYMASYFPELTILFIYIINLLLSFVITVFLFAIIFKVLPDAIIRWRDVTVGATATAILFMAGKFAIGYYLGSSSVATTYGAAGSVIIILLWIYYSAIILYFGAAFTKEYAQHFGYRIFPANAVWVKAVEVDSNKSLQEIEKDSGEQKIKPDK